jgi:hypothetical protein
MGHRRGRHLASSQHIFGLDSTLDRLGEALVDLIADGYAKRPAGRAGRL